MEPMELTEPTALLTDEIFEQMKAELMELTAGGACNLL